MPEPLPPIDYSSRDWVSLRADLIAAKRQRMPEWKSESPNDFGIVLIELFAYVGDMLSFYADRVANEAYLGTAVLRSSVYAQARLLDYRPTGQVAAKTTLQFTTPGAAGSVTIPAGTRVQTVPSAAGEIPVIFETDTALVIPGGGGSHVGTVAATQGETITDEAIGISSGAQYQRFALFRSPVIDGSQTVKVAGTEWVFYDHLLDAGPNDTAYTLWLDEGGITWIEFGDDVNGRIPNAGAAITATYRIGVGSIGNVGGGTLTQLTSAVVVGGVTQPIQDVSNTTEASGGADPESLDSIRINAPRSLAAINRAVTVEDYAALARRIGGVGKAKATATTPSDVTIYVAPSNAPGGLPSATVKQNVANYLEPRKMIGTLVTVSDPSYLNIDVTVDINVLPTYRRSVIINEVVKNISAVFAWDRVDFGSRVTLNSIYQAMNDTEGVAYGFVYTLDDVVSVPGTAADVVPAANQIPQAGTITVRNATGGII